MAGQRKALVTVTDEADGSIVARFVYPDDAIVFAAASTSNPEDDRRLRVQDPNLYYNDLYVGGVVAHA